MSTLCHCLCGVERNRNVHHVPSSAVAFMVSFGWIFNDFFWIIFDGKMLFSLFSHPRVRFCAKHLNDKLISQKKMKKRLPIKVLRRIVSFTQFTVSPTHFFLDCRNNEKPLERNSQITLKGGFCKCFHLLIRLTNDETNIYMNRPKTSLFEGTQSQEGSKK